MSATFGPFEMASVSRRADAIHSQDTLLTGFSGRFVLSSDLVPGDVYEISHPSLTQFPADSLLLSGDCIVNESMLTGEFLLVARHTRHY